MKRIAVVVLLALAASSPAWAISCSVVGVTPVSFGAYNVFSGSPVDGTGDMTLRCTGVVPADNITVDISRGGASGYSPRELASGSATLDYNLYLNAGRTVVWGNGTGGTSQYGPAAPPAGTDLLLTVYGRIPASQSVAAGAYGDTVVVTVNY